MTCRSENVISLARERRRRSVAAEIAAGRVTPLRIGCPVTVVDGHGHEHRGRLAGYWGDMRKTRLVSVELEDGRIVTCLRDGEGPDAA